ncbi:MAG: pyridoxal phosphate-dependent aminotransferase [Atribacterota bacterium]|nr:pyridoxal phosphate-dependent aminotransferase [Atribacterota bacterium]
MSDCEYNFDQVISRKGTYSAKWQGYEKRFTGYDVKDALCMWVADMDFSCPKEVIEAVQQRAAHGIYGYTSEDAVIAFKKAAAGWFERHYLFSTEIDWMIFIPGIVPSVNSVIQEFTNIGDGVIVQQPVYYPFSDAVLNCERKIRINQLKEEDGYYTIDFENLEKLAQEKNTKLIILCNPHNPVGRVWSKKELLQIVEVCHKNNVMVFSDEIHADFIMEGNQFTSAGTLPVEFRDKLIFAFAPSKTFNIAGLGASLIVIPDDKIRKRAQKRMTMNRYPGSSVFGPIAGEAAYLHGENYNRELVKYIESNFDYVVKYCAEELRGIQIKKPEGTYLAWLDFRKTGMINKEVNSFVLEKAKITVDPGEWFGLGGDCFVRMNLACPRSFVMEAMNRLKNAQHGKYA